LEIGLSHAGHGRRRGFEFMPLVGKDTWPTGNLLGQKLRNNQPVQTDFDCITQSFSGESDDDWLPN
jgi:hypothetical protein